MPAERNNNTAAALIFHPLTLPGGQIIPNRLAKAAMEENMAAAGQIPSPALIRLYQTWAQGGTGLLISGNVMVDPYAMTDAGAPVLADDKNLAAFQRWAAAGKSGGARFWLQLNHPGRQMQANLGQTVWAPSAVAMQMGKVSKRFPLPQVMDTAKIEEVISRFVTSACLAERAGFDGVEIHAAHGYLLSQFLSPLTNRRSDNWGGSLENRARMLTEIIRRIRTKVTPAFAVAVKLNSADFQRGGFDERDARKVVMMLGKLNVDLVELSGGSYEAPAMQGEARDGHTLAREAYFLQLAAAIAPIAAMPLMTTGGIRRRTVAEQVIKAGVAMAGMGTVLSLAPDLPKLWRQGQDPAPALAPITWKNKPIASLANMATVRYQLRRISRGAKPKPNIPPLWALLLQQAGEIGQIRRYKQYLAALRP